MLRYEPFRRKVTMATISDSADTVFGGRLRAVLLGGLLCLPAASANAFPNDLALYRWCAPAVTMDIDPESCAVGSLRDLEIQRGIDSWRANNVPGSNLPINTNHNWPTYPEMLGDNTRLAVPPIVLRDEDP